MSAAQSVYEMEPAIVVLTAAIRWVVRNLLLGKEIKPNRRDNVMLCGVGVIVLIHCREGELLSKWRFFRSCH
jgi:hypothetical protein